MDFFFSFLFTADIEEWLFLPVIFDFPIPICPPEGLQCICSLRYTISFLFKFIFHMAFKKQHAPFQVTTSTYCIYILFLSNTSVKTRE